MMGSAESTLTQRALSLQQQSKKVVKGLPAYVKPMVGDATELIDQLSELVVDLAKKVEGGTENVNGK